MVRRLTAAFTDWPQSCRLAASSMRRRPDAPFAPISGMSHRDILLDWTSGANGAWFGWMPKRANRLQNGEPAQDLKSRLSSEISRDQVDLLSQALKWFSASYDDPYITQWIKMEVQKQSGHKSDDEQIVTLICKNPNVNVVDPLKDSPIPKGNDGKFRMPMKHARPLLKSPERLWERVEDE
jgi:hypothetical protein